MDLHCPLGLALRSPSSSSALIQTFLSTLGHSDAPFLPHISPSLLAPGAGAWGPASFHLLTPRYHLCVFSHGSCHFFLHEWTFLQGLVSLPRVLEVSIQVLSVPSVACNNFQVF